LSRPYCHSPQLAGIPLSIPCSPRLSSFSCSLLILFFSLSLHVSSVTHDLIIPLPLDSPCLQDVVVIKSPDPTKFKLANALFPGMPNRPPSTDASLRERSASTGKSKVAAQAVLEPVEPASTTPSPAPLEGAVSVGPLVLLKGKQFSIPGTTTRFPSHVHSTPPGLVDAGWDSEVSAEA